MTDMSKMTVRQHKIAALKYALDRLKNDESAKYICWLLSDYRWKIDLQSGKVSSKKAGIAVHYLKQYIAKALGASYDSFQKEYSEGRGLENWLHDQGIDCGYSSPENTKLQQTRINYVKWMLSCYGEK